MNIYVLIGVILTFIASIISIYYSRKNLKTSKYIDIVTSNRLKRISKVREMVADLVAKTSITLDICKNQFEYERAERERDKPNYNNWEEDMRQSLGIKKDIAISSSVNNYTVEDLIKELYLLKLWIDEEKYGDLSKSVNCFITFFENESAFLLEEEIKNTKGNIISFVKSTNLLINSELELISKETEGKISEKEIKWGIIGYPLFNLYKFLKWLIIMN